MNSKKQKLMDKTVQDSSRSGPLAISALSTDTTVRQAPATSDPDLFNNVFTNDVIWEMLGGYLNLDDLKDCRLTCQLFNLKIIDLKSFKDRARLNIPLSKFPVSDLRKTRIKWRHLAINVDLDEDDTNTETWQDFHDDPLSDLSQLFSSIISLKLYRTNYCRFKILPGIPETFSKILPMMSNIQGISIDLKIFEKIPLVWFAITAATLMSKVKELRLECKDDNYSVPDEVMYSSMSLPSAFVHLQVFCLDSFIWRWISFRGLDRVVDGFGQLFPILRKNQNHLMSLQIKDPTLWTGLLAERFGTLPKFPQLKVLQLQIMTEERDPFFSEAHLIQFLNNQPVSLEEIDLKFIGPFPSAVFQILKDRAMKLNLRVLRVSSDIRQPGLLSDMKKWNFLKETNLEEFSLKLGLYGVHLTNAQLKDFMGALPKKAKRLTISGFHEPRGEDIVDLDVSNCFNPEVLTHLNLGSCPALVNDSILQEIWKTLKNLRLLDVSYCQNDCTDWGFTGVADGLRPQGVAISLLKGLKFLTLQGCVELTDRTLMDGIVFPELQFLDLKNNTSNKVKAAAFTESGFLAVIRQNPSLQKLLVEHDKETHDLLRHINFPRIRSVKINSRLTREFSLDYGCDRCTSDISSDDEF